MTDEEVVKKIVEGERSEYGKIIERYQGKLFGYIKNLINQNNMEVEDLVEETLISAYQNLNGFEASKKFSSWIYRIAHNKAIDYFKKKKIKTSQIEEEIERDFETRLLEELEVEKEKARMVKKAVNSLELKYKELVLLYFFDDKNYDEISDILHISTSGVGVLLFRAKEKLRKIIKDEK